MLFIIETKDRHGALDLRLKTRDEHLKYLDALGEKLVLAGPFLDENEKPCGSLIVVKVENIAQAKEIAKNDPYQLAGLFESSSTRAWLWAINKPEGL